MNKIVIVGICVVLAILSDGTKSGAAQSLDPESVEKTVCVSTLAYDDLEEIKSDLLLSAKREAVNELFGEVLASTTTIDNLEVTRNQIRVQSLGLIRVAGDPRYFNGPNTGEVCVTITAYVTAMDRKRFEILWANMIAALLTATPAPTVEPMVEPTVASTSNKTAATRTPQPSLTRTPKPTPTATHTTSPTPTPFSEIILVSDQVLQVSSQPFTTKELSEYDQWVDKDRADKRTWQTYEVAIDKAIVKEPSWLVVFGNFPPHTLGWTRVEPGDEFGSAHTVRVAIPQESDLISGTVLSVQLVIDNGPNPFTYEEGLDTLAPGEYTFESFNAFIVPVATPVASHTPLATETPAPTDTATPVSTATSQFEKLTATVLTDANIRSGPGTNYPIIGSATSGDTFAVTGENADNTWWQIAYDSQSGWIAGTLVNVSIPTPVDGALYFYVPAGEFTMGSESGWHEQPSHAVMLDSYWIMQTEVTNRTYGQCMAAGACTAPSNNRWNNPLYAEHPVVSVDWFQARDYARWVGGRLPTEAEWEKAARGTDKRSYPWGNEFPSPLLANFNSNVGDTVAVGSYPAGASPYGALDMAGNAWEWVEDWYDPQYYASSPATNPLGPSSGELRVLRGGSSYNDGNSVRTTHRGLYDPENWDNLVGFRVVMSSMPGLEDTTNELH